MRFVTSVAAVLALAGCGGSEMRIDTIVGKQAIITATNKALTLGDCTAAIAHIEPLYHSKYTDNQVRLIYASAHGCNAGINFFELIGDLVASPPVGTALWTTAARLFYSSQQIKLDKRIESTRRAQEALMAVKRGGTVVSPVDLINGSGFNPGSLLAQDRTADSNLYMVLISLASLGALQNRYSDPDPSTWHKQQVLGYRPTTPDGWASALNTAGHGCGFAASFLNLIDAVDRVAVDPGGPGGESLLEMTTMLKPVIGLACNYGCRGTAAGVIPGAPPEVIDFSGTGCNLNDDICSGSGDRPCPVALRDPTSCNGEVNHRPSCAAAGLAKFLNEHTTLGWP